MGRSTPRERRRHDPVAQEAVAKGRMPPRDYLVMHPESWLSTADRRALAGGLEATFAPLGEHGGQRVGHGEAHDRDGD